VAAHLTLVVSHSQLSAPCPLESLVGFVTSFGGIVTPEGITDKWEAKSFRLKPRRIKR